MAKERKLACTDEMLSEAAFIGATLANAQGDKAGTIACLEESLRLAPHNQNAKDALAKFKEK